MEALLLVSEVPARLSAIVALGVLNGEKRTGSSLGSKIDRISIGIEYALAVMEAAEALVLVAVRDAWWCEVGKGGEARHP